MHFPDNILEQKANFVFGVEIGMQTLLGVNKSKYPVRHGNCFSMSADNGKSYRIVNFYVENLEEGIKRGKIELPVRLYILGDAEKSHTAIIYDTRIPTSWYRDDFCSTCTPVMFLPFPQRVERELKIESGAITINGNMCIERIGDGVADWRTEEEKKPIVYANYRPVVQEPIIFMGSEIEALMMEALREELKEDCEKADKELLDKMVRTADFRGFPNDKG